MIASSPLAIREAHFAKADAAAAFVAALSFLLLVRRPRSMTVCALTTGAVAGLAMSTKYLVAFAAMPLVALGGDLGWRLRDGRWRPAALAVAVAGIVFLTLAPAWLHDPGLSFGFLWSVAASQQDYPRLPFFAGWVERPSTYHVTVSLRYGAGLLVALLALPALLRGLWRPGASRLIAIAVVAHGLVLLTNPLVVARNLLPSLSGIVVLVADLVCTAVLRSPFSRRRAVAACLVGLVLIAEPLSAGVRLVSLLGEPDTRASAGRWIAEHVPPDARVITWGAPAGAADFGAPALHGRAAPRALPVERWSGAGVAYVVRHSYPLPFSSAPEPADWPEMRAVAVFDPFDGPIDDPVLEPLDAFYLPLARFDGITRPGPRITIYEVRR
jgi:hypothetical protein